MSCFIQVAQAISNADDSLRASYIQNASSAVGIAFILMDLHAAWQPVLDLDTDNGVMAAMTPGESGMASYWQLQYQMDSENKDTQCNIWEDLVQSNQTQVNSDSTQRKGNFGLVDGMASACAVLNSVLLRFNR